MPPKRQPTQRFGLTPAEKYNLAIERKKPENLKLTYKEFGEKFRRPDGKPTPISTLSDIFKNLDKIVSDGPPLGPDANKKKLVKEEFPYLERELVLWCHSALERRLRLTDDLIRESAYILAERLSKEVDNTEDYTDFKFSDGWIHGFKNRHNIGKHKLQGEAGSADMSTIEPSRMRLRDLTARYEPDRVYNCDETAFNWSQQPNTTLAFGGKDHIILGTKLDKNRATAFLIVNATGTDKRRIVFIHKWKMPRSFAENGIRNHAALPVDYYYNKKAWMRAIVWYSVLQKLEDVMRILRREILLLSDNVSSHPRPENPPAKYVGPTPPVLKWVRLEFLDPNLTAFLQPLDAGIIACFKARYRQRFLKHCVEEFNKNPSAFNVDKTINIYNAIVFCSDAWDSIPASIIFNCWQKTGIVAAFDKEVIGGIKYEAYMKHIREKTTVSVASLLNATHDPEVKDGIGNGLAKQVAEEFLGVDEDNLPEQDIVDLRAEVLEHVEESLEDRRVNDSGVAAPSSKGKEKEIEEPVRERMSDSNAIKALDDLSFYFKGLEGKDSVGGKQLFEIIKDLDVTRRDLELFVNNQKKQTKISSFFKTSTAGSGGEGSSTQKRHVQTRSMSREAEVSGFRGPGGVELM